MTKDIVRSPIYLREVGAMRIRLPGIQTLFQAGASGAWFSFSLSEQALDFLGELFEDRFIG